MNGLSPDSRSCVLDRTGPPLRGIEQPSLRPLVAAGHDEYPIALKHTAALRVGLVLSVALALRCALMPITEGWDFHAFARLAALSLHGHDVYGMKRSDLPLPWTYFPLCLHMYQGLLWLSLHTGWSFRIVGKIPVALADLGIGWLIYREFRRHGSTVGRAMAGMALYLFNPLVLLNGALLGRFDAVALVFLLLALDQYRTSLFAPAYALAIAAKTFPIFVLPLLLMGRDRQAPRKLLLACVIVLILALPRLVTDPTGMLRYMLYDARATWFGRLSWYQILGQEHWLTWAQVVGLARIVMFLYPVLLVSLAHCPLYLKVTAAYLLFLGLNRAVWEQYVLWALPFMLVVALLGRSRFALCLVGICTIAGMLENEQTWTPLDPLYGYRLLPTPCDWLSILLAVSALTFVVHVWFHSLNETSWFPRAATIEDRRGVWP